MACSARQLVASDDTELFKQFMDNTGFKQWMTNAVFELACKQADPPLHTANL